MSADKTVPFSLPSGDRPLTTEQAAEIIGVKPKTLSNWRGQNKGPPYLAACGKIVYRLKAILRWMDQNTHGQDSHGRAS